MLKHYCELPDERGGLPRLPPNAPLRHRFMRWLREGLSPNPNLAIAQRNFRNKSQIKVEARRHANSKFFYIIHPFSDMECGREVMYLFVGTWAIVAVLLIASFGWVARYSLKKSTQIPRALYYPSWLSFLLQVVWILSCFFAGYQEPHGKSLIELNQIKIAKKYMSSYFLIDLMTLSPPLMPHYFWSYICWINLAVVFRCPTTVDFLRRLLRDLRLSEEIITTIILMVVSFYFVHMFACIYYLIPIVAHDGKQPLWVENVHLHPEKSLNIKYYGCFSVVQSHFWGLGESTTRTENSMEELVLIVVMIAGRLWSLFVMATMLRVFTISSLSESKYEQYLLQLQTFIAHKKLPKEMEERLLEYYEYKYQHHYFNEKAIFSALSHYLKQELTLYRAKNVIKNVQVFKYFPRSVVATIIAKCNILVFMNNDYVVKAGDVMDRVYFISSGTVAVFNTDKYELIHLIDGEEIGIKAATTFGDVRFKFSYISIETTEVYAIRVKDFREAIYSKADILKFFQRKVEERVALWHKIETIATTQGVDLLSELKHEKVLEQPRIRTRFFENY